MKRRKIMSTVLALMLAIAFVPGASPVFADDPTGVTPEVTPPVMPEISTVVFNLAGGVRVGGGALTQAVVRNGSAVEPYVYRQGYIFLEWDQDFTNVQQNMTITARWVLQGVTLPVEPPIVEVITGHFLNNKNSFKQTSHIPLIYYADSHISRFTSVEVNGYALSGRQYVATTGTARDTTAIHLKASYLNTLPVGTHTLTVYFDGIYVEADFTVTPYVNMFYDVNYGDWFYAGVGAMNASELLLGINNTQFNPGGNMTRGMVVTLLYRFAGEPGTTGNRSPFPDVRAGQYYTNAVIWAAANGIVTGHDTGYFAPNDMMTREQFAAVLYRYQNALGSQTTDILMGVQYSDFYDISLYARSAVNKLTMQGVYSDWPGNPEGNFMPRATVSRAEVATAMRLWIESIGW